MTHFWCEGSDLNDFFSIKLSYLGKIPFKRSMTKTDDFGSSVFFYVAWTSIECIDFRNISDLGVLECAEHHLMCSISIFLPSEKRTATNSCECIEPNKNLAASRRTRILDQRRLWMSLIRIRSDSQRQKSERILFPGPPLHPIFRRVRQETSDVALGCRRCRRWRI